MNSRGPSRARWRRWARASRRSKAVWARASARSRPSCSRSVRCSLHCRRKSPTRCRRRRPPPPSPPPSSPPAPTTAATAPGRSGVTDRGSEPRQRSRPLRPRRPARRRRRTGRRARRRRRLAVASVASYGSYGSDIGSAGSTGQPPAATATSPAIAPPAIAAAAAAEAAAPPPEPTAAPPKPPPNRAACKTRSDRRGGGARRAGGAARRGAEATIDGDPRADLHSVVVVARAGCGGAGAGVDGRRGERRPVRRPDVVLERDLRRVHMKRTKYTPIRHSARRGCLLVRPACSHSPTGFLQELGGDITGQPRQDHLEGRPPSHHQDDPLAHLAVRGAQLAEVLATDLADEVARAEGECLRAPCARRAAAARPARPAIVLDLTRPRHAAGRE